MRRLPNDDLLVNYALARALRKASRTKGIDHFMNQSTT